MSCTEEVWLPAVETRADGDRQQSFRSVDSGINERIMNLRRTESRCNEKVCKKLHTGRMRITSPGAWYSSRCCKDNKVPCGWEGRPVVLGLAHRSQVSVDATEMNPHPLRKYTVMPNATLLVCRCSAVPPTLIDCRPMHVCHLPRPEHLSTSFVR